MGLLDSLAQRFGYTKLQQQPTLQKSVEREGMAYNPLSQAYQQMWNSQYGLRKANQITMQTLRRMATANWVDRTCIETLRDEITGIPWDIIPINPKQPWDTKFQQFIIQMLKRPNRNNENWRTLIDKVVEDILVVDAGCVEKVRNGDGMLVELWHVDGATIKPCYDKHGVIGNPAYKQYLPSQKDMTKPMAEWGNEDLIYIMWNPQGNVDSFGYGMSPVEAGLAVGTAFLYAEAYNLTFFKNNAIPPTIINMGKEVTPAELDKFRMFLASEMMGPNGFHQPVITSLGEGASVIPLLKAPADMAWEKYVEWQMRWKVALYRMSPQDIGFNLDQYKVEGEVQAQMSQNKAINSLKNVLKHYIDTEIIGDFGFSHWNYNLQFQWIDTDVVDPLDQAAVDKIYLNAGVVSINEIRQRDGKDPIAGGTRPIIVSGATMVPVDSTPIAQDENVGLQPVMKSETIEKVYVEEEGEICPMNNSQDAIAWMDDRGVTQPLFITDSGKKKGLQIKPAFLDEKRGQEPPEAEVAMKLRAMKVNTPEVQIMGYEQILQLVPQNLYEDVTNYIAVKPPYDSQQWRQRWGDTRQSNYYIVTGFISGRDLGNHQLQKDMAVSPDSYKNAVKDLARVWIAERMLYLGDRKPGHYIITNAGNGYGVDYQFYQTKTSWDKTNYFLPQTLMLINEDLGKLFVQSVVNQLVEMKKAEELDEFLGWFKKKISLEKAYRKLVPDDWESMKGYEDVEKEFGKVIQKGIYEWYKKAVDYKNKSNPVQTVRKAQEFDPDQDYLTNGVYVWQNGIKYPISVLPKDKQPTKDDFLVGVADYSAAFKLGIEQAEVLIEPNLPDGIIVHHPEMYTPYFEQRVNLLKETMTDTIKNQVNDIIAKGLDSGASFGMIADQIQTSLGIDPNDPTFPKWRAERIARTEAQWAVNEGMRQQYKRVGIYKVNVAISHNACPICTEVAAGNPFNVEEAYNLVPIHPNCRCALVGDYEDLMKSYSLQKSSSGNWVTIEGKHILIGADGKPTNESHNAGTHKGGIIIPSTLTNNAYRKDLAKRAEEVLQTIKKEPFSDDITHIEIVGSFITSKEKPGDVDMLIHVNKKSDSAENWNTTQVFNQNQNIRNRIDSKVDAIVIQPNHEDWAEKIKNYKSSKGESVSIYRR